MPTDHECFEALSRGKAAVKQLVADAFRRGFEAGREASAKVIDDEFRSGTGLAFAIRSLTVPEEK